MDVNVVDFLNYLKKQMYVAVVIKTQDISQVPEPGLRHFQDKLTFIQVPQKNVRTIDNTLNILGSDSRSTEQFQPLDGRSSLRR